MIWRHGPFAYSGLVVITTLLRCPLLVAQTLSTVELHTSDALIQRPSGRSVRRLSKRRRLRGLQTQGGKERKYVYDEIYKEPDIPVVRFPLSNQISERKHGNDEQKDISGTVKAGHDTKEPTISEPICQPVILDFQKAADGRFLRGGTFVEYEWSSGYGIKIKASNREGKKNLHPMIFDSLNVESNEVETNDVFFLGSPNFDCGGLGVGVGGRLGQVGQNCNSLGNLLVPYRKAGASTKQSNRTVTDRSQGGILTFEFEKYTEVRKIGLLNAGDNSTIETWHNASLSGRIDVSSVGTNGYQKVQVGIPNVDTLDVSLTSFSGVTELDMCIQLDFHTSGKGSNGNKYGRRS
jgi:hypothetical protein